MRTRHGTRGGFTLIETLAALAILLTSLLALTQILFHAEHSRRSARAGTRAALLVAGAIEKLGSAEAPRAGGGLDPNRPVDGFHDRVPPEARGTDPILLRLWHISEDTPPVLTVSVVLAGPEPRELARAAALLGAPP